MSEFFIAGILGLIGNLWVITVIMSSRSMRQKLINILFTSQSCLDFLCGLLLILTCRDHIFVPKGGHHGIKGNYHFLIQRNGTISRILQQTLFRCTICKVHPDVHSQKNTPERVDLCVSTTY